MKEFEPQMKRLDSQIYMQKNYEAGITQLIGRRLSKQESARVCDCMLRDSLKASGSRFGVYEGSLEVKRTLRQNVKKSKRFLNQKSWRFE